MRARAAENISVADVAAAAYVSVRGLQVLFQRHVHMSPMRYLRRVRLARVHAALSAGDPAIDTVASVATACGFQHYGHFAEHYREVYGCRPIDTLRGTSPTRLDAPVRLEEIAVSEQERTFALVS